MVRLLEEVLIDVDNQPLHLEAHLNYLEFSSAVKSSNNSENITKPSKKVSTCIVFSTSGLYKFFEQDELVFIVKCVDDKVEPTHPIVKERFSKMSSLFRQFLKLVYDYACREVLVDEKDYTEFSSPFLRDFTGFTYSRQHLPPAAIIKDPLAPYLMVIPITSEELTLAKSFGCTRLQALLGESFRWFPCPPWFDYQRHSVVSAEVYQRMKRLSMLSKMPQVCISGVTALYNHNQKILYLNIAQKERENLKENVEQLMELQFSCFALRCSIDLRAGGHCICALEELPTEIKGIENPDGDSELISGSFCAFGFARNLEQEQELEVKLTEDGFLVSVSSQQLYQYLIDLFSESIKENTFEYENPQGISFAIQFVDTKEEQNTTSAAIQISSIQLLSEDEDFVKRVNTQHLAEFIPDIQSVLLELWQEMGYKSMSTPISEMLIQVEYEKDTIQPSITIQSDEEDPKMTVTKKILKHMRASKKIMNGLKVSKTGPPIAFEVNFLVPK